MKRLGPLKYLTVFTLPILSYISFNSTGWIVFLPVIEAFALIPLLELVFKPNPENISEEEEEGRLSNIFYDLVVYAVLPVHFFCLYIFLNSISTPGLDITTIAGRVVAMGMLCGVLGINVAHELGHRKRKSEQWMAKLLLMTSLYMHFFIEHNRGHHRHVSTPEDPSSARLGESLYMFWVRSVWCAYLSAWKLEFERMEKNNWKKLSWRNEMLQFQFIQLGFITLVYWFFGWPVLIYFLVSAVMGFLLLETVNYIEHYGLERSKSGGRYERVLPAHSWNSDHIVGRLMLFELSRHSDHHYKASRKYQILRHIDESPQMPTGYPGMILLATIPPIWHSVMRKRINDFKKKFQ